jgi:hypothetical protein
MLADILKGRMRLEQLINPLDMMMNTPNLKRRRYPEMNKWKIFYCLSLFTGIGLMVLEIGIYRVTIIQTMIPISITLVVGSLSFFFNKD